MPFGRSKSPEELASEQAATAARKQAQKEEAEAKRAAAVAKQEQAAAQREQQLFDVSPAGRARAAFARGDHIFQASIDVMSQQAVIVAMMGGTTTKKTTDPVDVLNSVCREGWDLITGSFVFVEQGQESRDKFLSSGQNVAIKGSTVGYYLFRRDVEMRHSFVTA